MALLHIPFGSACRNDILIPRGRNGLRHWLIAGFRYAAQAAAMREGHLWDITPRVASGERGGELPLAAKQRASWRTI
jgi:hypothetical protein